jgi:hypothetical protein
MAIHELAASVVQLAAANELTVVDAAIGRLTTAVTLVERDSPELAAWVAACAERVEAWNDARRRREDDGPGDVDRRLRYLTSDW